MITLKETVAPRRVLLIIGGGIAAYKCLELIRLLRDQGVEATPVMTRAAANFVTPLSVSALAGAKVHESLFELTAEVEMGHIELSRSADLIVVAPATADLMAKMAQGFADDLASTVLLATDTPVMIAPAMNVRMWEHPATQRNLAVLRDDGVAVIGPNEGAMACGEFGPGRMAEPSEILSAIMPGNLAATPYQRLAGLRAIVTSGPTHEPIDPVRYIANRSSGRQGVAIAEALAARGADVRFVTGPAAHRAPSGCALINVETARQMRDAVMNELPADFAIFAAAVADWRTADATGSKIKRQANAKTPPKLRLTENPDILAEISALSADERPRLVVGFAAETDDVLENARAKRRRKGCDWLVANDVSGDVMGGLNNEATLITESGEEAWPRLSKREVATRLAEAIGDWAARRSA